MTECPYCGADVQLSDDVVENELVECLECGTTLEVVQLDPPQLDLAPDEEEDWGQ